MWSSGCSGALCVCPCEEPQWPEISEFGLVPHLGFFQTAKISGACVHRAVHALVCQIPWSLVLWYLHPAVSLSPELHMDQSITHRGSSRYRFSAGPFSLPEGRKESVRSLWTSRAQGWGSCAPHAVGCQSRWIKPPHVLLECGGSPGSWRGAGGAAGSVPHGDVLCRSGAGGGGAVPQLRARSLCVQGKPSDPPPRGRGRRWVQGGPLGRRELGPVGSAVPKPPSWPCLSRNGGKRWSEHRASPGLGCPGSCLVAGGNANPFDLPSGGLGKAGIAGCVLPAAPHMPLGINWVSESLHCCSISL